MKVEKEFRGKVVFQRSESSSIKCQCTSCKKWKDGKHIFSTHIDGDFMEEDFIKNLLYEFDKSSGDFEGKEIIMKITMEEKQKAEEMK